MEGIPSKGVMCNAYIILKGLVLTKTNLLITTWTISVWTAATLLDQVSPALTSHVASTFAWQPHRTTAQALKLFRFCRRFATGKMVKRCVVYGCGNSCKTEHRYCPRNSEESDNRSRESSELRLSHPNDELASRHLRSAFRRQLLQHGSLTDGRIVGLRGEENKNSCTWHCPDNYAHTVMIPPPTPVSRRQRSVGGPVGVAVRGCAPRRPSTPLIDTRTVAAEEKIELCQAWSCSSMSTFFTRSWLWWYFHFSQLYFENNKCV